MAKCKIGGQAVLEGVMMKSQTSIALAVRRSDGEIKTELINVETKAKKGTFWGLPFIRGVVAFIESITLGMKTMTRSAELAGEFEAEQPSKFEKFLTDKLGLNAEKVAVALAVVLALGMTVGLFFMLPTLISSLIFRGSQVTGIWKSLTEGIIRLVIFIGYILAVSGLKDIRRVFMYHGAEHKVIACYEAEEELTPENAVKHTRLHPRCGTNYLFLVMAVSILFFAIVGWGSNVFVRLGLRLLFLPVVAGISYEVLMLAAKSDGIIARIVRAPGLALQKLTTREPELPMLEVAIKAFNLALEA